MMMNSYNKPWAYICSKGYFAGLSLGGAHFREGLFFWGFIIGILRYLFTMKSRNEIGVPVIITQ